MRLDELNQRKALSQHEADLRKKVRAGLTSAADYQIQELIAKLDKILLTGNTNSQLDMIYQWVKTGHIKARQFRQLISWWVKQMEDRGSKRTVY
ncbi:MAG: hypothetical protein E4H14_05535 [Candidatus Thorarchaeota archaeon]|nr:MAG: hypothetical protein E4H14_05535 [Candidatus Thorarchaeota archaeon]